MAEIIPFFEVNGRKYEIYRTRYLMAEYDKMSDETKLSDEDTESAVKAQNLLVDMQKYAEKEKEFWDKFCETADDEDERKYLKFKSLREKAVSDYALIGDTAKKIQKRGIDILEQIAIKGLSEQYSMSASEAEKVWCDYVDVIGKDKAAEWLAYMSQCLFTDEEEKDDNSFLAQMRKKAQERADNRKMGMKRK